MRARWLPSILVVAASFVSSAQVNAQQAVSQSVRPHTLDVQFSGFIQPGLRFMPFLDQARRILWMSDTNVDGKVSAADLERRKARIANGIRVKVISELLRYDDDGDGVVTRAEVLRIETQRIRARARFNPVGATEALIRKQIDEAVATPMRADKNGDRRIAWTEMLDFGRTRPTTPTASMESEFRFILALDENADGATDSAEFERAAERIFRSIDLDGDETLSRDEVDAFRARIGSVVVAIRPSDEAVQLGDQEP